MARPPSEPSEVELLRDELDNKDIQLRAVQRNYDGMSRMMREKQKQLEQVNILLNEERASNADLKVRLDDTVAQVGRAEEQTRSNSKWKQQFESLKQEKEGWKLDVSFAKSSGRALQEKIDSMRLELECVRKDKERAVEDARQAIESCKGGKQQLDEKDKELERVLSEKNALDKKARAHADHARRAMELSTEHERKISAMQRAYDDQKALLERGQEAIRYLKHQVEEERTTKKALDVALIAAKEHHSVLESRIGAVLRSRELQEHENGGLLAKAKEQEHTKKMLQQQVSRLQSDLDKANLEVAASNDRIRMVLDERKEVGGVVENLSHTLTQTQALLAECKRERAKDAASYEEELCKRQQREAEIESRTMDAESRAVREMLFHKEQLQSINSTIASLCSRFEGIVSIFTQEICSCQSQQEAVASDTQRHLLQWNVQLEGIEQGLENMQGAAAHSQLRFHSTSNKSQVSRDCEKHGLLVRLRELEDKAAHYQTTAFHIREECSRKIEKYELKLTQLKCTCDDQLKEQQQRLASRLMDVESELESLKASCEQKQRCLKELVHMERKKANAELQELKERNAAMEDSMADRIFSSQQEITKLHNQHSMEMESLKLRSRTELDSLSRELEGMTSSIERSFEIVGKLWTDIEQVDKHMVKMGVRSERRVTGAASELQHAPTPERLLKGLSVLRLHFSYMTENFQDIVKDANMKHGNEKAQLVILQERARQLRSTVQKLIHTEESLSSNYTCMACLSIFDRPVTCVPCGHTYCDACLSGNQMCCSECGDRMIVKTVPNHALERLCSKYEYKRSTLASMLQICPEICKERNSGVCIDVQGSVPPVLSPG